MHSSVKRKSESTKAMDATTTINESHIAEVLERQGYYDVSGEDLIRRLRLRESDISDFASYWQRLTLDKYMGDGGCYRYRRYNALYAWADRKALTLLPRHPYVQPGSVNTLNGDIDRYFDDLDDGFISHPVLVGLLQFLTRAYNASEMALYGKEKPEKWLIQLHPYRVVADGTVSGKPTPEGLHRDGVDYVLSLMLGRNNVIGGETTVTDVDTNTLYQRLLTNPMDMLVCDDRRVLHSVSEIRALLPDQGAWRDVLVIAFTRQ